MSLFITGTPAMVIITILLIISVVLIVTFFVKWSWNASLPEMITGTKRVTYVPALGFVILLLVVTGIVCGVARVVIRR